jgi:hypothetical protein
MTGVQLSSLQDSRSSCVYRIAQEGLPLLLPAVTKQRLALCAADMLRLLTEGSVALPESHKLPMQSTAVRLPVKLCSGSLCIQLKIQHTTSVDMRLPLLVCTIE